MKALLFSMKISLLLSSLTLTKLISTTSQAIQIRMANSPLMVIPRVRAECQQGETIFSRAFESNAFGQELRWSQSFDMTGGDYEGSDIEIISTTKYWASVSDILHFNTKLDNPTGVKSIFVSEKIDANGLILLQKQRKKSMERAIHCRVVLGGAINPYKTASVEQQYLERTN